MNAQPSHDDLIVGMNQYAAANATVNDWIAGAQAVALLRAALSSGIFDALRVSRSAAEVAAVTGGDPATVADVCLALAAHGVAERRGEHYTLTPNFFLLASPDVVQALPYHLDGAAVMTAALENVAAPERPYPTLPAPDRLRIAHWAAALPTSPLMQAFVPAMAAAMPEVGAVWERGGRHLELGCGVGSLVVRPLATFPRLRAVGIDLDAGVLDEARRYAAALGVADRVEWRHADVRDLTEESAYDTALWSQQFFVEESRTDVLRVALRALKPGGHMIAPVLVADTPATEEALESSSGRAYTINKLVYGHWELPMMTLPALHAEAVTAGFAVVRVVQTDFGVRYLLLQRPSE